MQFGFDITLLIRLTLNKPIATGVIPARIHSNAGTNATCFSEVTSKRFIMGPPLQFQRQHFTSDRKSIHINHITVGSGELLGLNYQSLSLCEPLEWGLTSWRDDEQHKNKYGKYFSRKFTSKECFALLCVRCASINLHLKQTRSWVMEKEQLDCARCWTLGASNQLDLKRSLLTRWIITWLSIH